MAEHDDIEKLRKESCPPLDEALFISLLGDYDLQKDEQREAFTAIISQLKLSALEEENADFNASGTGGLSNQQYEANSAVSQSSPDEESASNGVTSFTTGLSELKWDESNDLGSDLEQMPLEGKQTWLKNMFPEITPFEIKQVLRKCHGALNRSIDELLNLSFLKQDHDKSDGSSSPIPKSVDGFAVDGKLARVRTGRSKRKTKMSESSRTSSANSFQTDDVAAKANVWTSLTEAVDFVCARTSLQPQTVKSVYHANSADLPATVGELAIKESEKVTSLEELDVNTQVQIADMKSEFASLSEMQLYGLLRLVGNIPSAASELAEVMVRSSWQKSLPLGKVDGFAQYAPLKLQDEQEPTTSGWKMVRYASTKPSGVDHGLAADTAFAQAGAANRQGRSDRHMAGVAEYYSQVGHEHVKLAKQNNAAAADALVAAQSSAVDIDLHGVNVADAVRITRTRTQDWWESLGDAKFQSGGGGPARAGFRIITGIGRHSRDGAPKIGPAVSKMLIREGWKVEIGQGELMVYGKARRYR